MTRQTYEVLGAPSQQLQSVLLFFLFSPSQSTSKAKAHWPRHFIRFTFVSWGRRLLFAPLARPKGCMGLPRETEILPKELQSNPLAGWKNGWMVPQAISASGLFRMAKLCGQTLCASAGRQITFSDLRGPGPTAENDCRNCGSERQFLQKSVPQALYNILKPSPSFGEVCS